MNRKIIFFLIFLSFQANIFSAQGYDGDPDLERAIQASLEQRKHEKEIQEAIKNSLEEQKKPAQLEKLKELFTYNDKIPSSFEKEHLFDLEGLTPLVLFNTLRKVHDQFIQEKNYAFISDFEKLNQSLQKEFSRFFKLNKQKVETISALIASMVVQSFPDLEDYDNYTSLVFLNCHCINFYWRVVQMFFTASTFAATMKSEDPLNYVSLASGNLLTDYLLLTTLIKLGYLNIVIDIIDHLYESPIALEKEGKLFKIVMDIIRHPQKLNLVFKKEDKVLMLDVLGNEMPESIRLALQSDARLSSQNQVELARVFKKFVSKDLMNGLIGYFEILLSQAAQEYYNTVGSAQDVLIKVRFWNNVDLYLQSLVYKKRKDTLIVERLAPPHIVLLSDTHGEKDIHDLILKDFYKITEQASRDRSLVSILYRDIKKEKPQIIFKLEGIKNRSTKELYFLSE
jgi:hypothetical protein